MKIYKSFKYELRLTPEQKQLCLQIVGTCRFVWNKALHLKKTCWEENKQSISLKELDKRLTSWKKQYQWLFVVPSQSLQQVLKDLDQAFQHFFNNDFGYPQFKKKYKNSSFRIKQGQHVAGKLSKKVGLIKLPKLGVVRFTKTRELEGVLKYSTISLQAGKWYISCCCVIERDIVPHVKSSKIGLDRGVKKTIQCSNGDVLKDLSPSNNEVRKLKTLQKKLANKKKGSSNRRKIIVQLQKTYARLSNKRRDAIHKFTTKIAKNHGVVVLEKLPIKNMTKSAKGTIRDPGKNVKAKSGLNKSILEQCWYFCENTLAYKMFWSGGIIAYVDARYTSQKCHKCYHIARENRKTQATFHCVNCGHKENADLNASKNILAAYMKAEGQSVLACGEVPLGASMKQELGMRKPVTV